MGTKNWKKVFLNIVSRNKKIEENLDIDEYEHLRPNNNVSRESFDALEYAFSDENNTNIAITGNYSSGKSSILESFIKQRFEEKEKDKVFTLSLATLSSDKKEYEAKEIEKSIIEQLYYSNLEELRNVEKFFLKALSIASSLFLFDIIYIFLLSKNDFFMKIAWIIRAVLYLTFIVLMIIFLYKLFGIIQKCNKLSITASNIEIDISEESRDSNIINKELGLIQSVVKRMGIKYIIFEDLDRFNKSIIFEHLRELNIILNNHKKIGLFKKTKFQKIKFIYLIRDELFKNENRTKFFDFIYPVVPFVTYGTSGNAFNELIKKYNLQNELDEKYILEVCLYINDFRILKNALNEYKIYKKDLNITNLPYKELFSLLLYKNIFSEDFAKLQNYDGKLYSQIIELENEKNKTIEKLNDKIIQYEEQKILAKQYEIDNKDILDTIWNEILFHVGEYGRTIRFKNGKNSYIVDTNLDKFKEKIPLEILLNEKTSIVYSTANKLFEIVDLSKIINKNDTISDKIHNYKINMDKIVKTNEERIASYKEDIQKIKGKTSFFLEFNNMKDLVYFKNDNINNQLVQYLIRKDYITSNYKDYITQFHPGNLSKNDAEYLMALKINKSLNYDYRFDNIEKIFERLSEDDFNNSSIANIFILKELIKNKDEYRIYKICNHFHKWNELIEFLLYILKNYSEDEQKYFFSIYIKRKDFWLNLSYKAGNNIQEVSKILEKLLLNLKKEYIPNIWDIENLCKFIKVNNLMVNDIKYSEIIKILMVRYKDITLDIFNTEIRKICIENNCFEINEINLKYIFDNYLNLEPYQFEIKNFSNICKRANFEKYIKNHIDIYLSNVYLKMSEKGKVFENDEKDVLYLLNNEKFNSKLKEKILESEKTNISNIDSANNIVLKTLLFRNNKIIPNWKNIIKYFNIVKKVNDVLASFINTNKDALLNLLDEFNACRRNSKFNVAMYTCDNINNDIYELIISNTNLILDFNYLKDISKEKMEILIKNSKIQVKNEDFKKFKEIFGYELLSMYNKEKLKKVNNELKVYTLDELNLILEDEKMKKELGIDLSIMSDQIDFKNSTSKAIDEFVDYIISDDINIKFNINDIDYIIKNRSYIKIWNFLYYYFNKLEKNEIINIINMYFPQYESLINGKEEIYNYNEKLILLIQTLKIKGIKIQYKILDDKILVNKEITSLLL